MTRGGMAKRKIKVPVRSKDSNSGKIFLGHLNEFRGGLIKSLIAIGCGTIISFVFTPRLFHFLLLPYTQLQKTRAVPFIISESNFIISLGPSEAFLTGIKLAFINGAIIGLPVIIYQLWKFISPGLLPKEYLHLKIIAFLSPFLFFTGILFAYNIVFPLALKFMWNYTLNAGVYPGWSLDYYVNFFIGFLLSFGIAFELPLVIVLLSISGLVTPRFLSEKRRHVVVIIFLLSAVVTPPDVVSQVLLGIPLVGLYELSILMAKLVAHD